MRILVVLLLSFLLTGCTQVGDIIGKYEMEPTQAVKATSESKYVILNHEQEILDLLLDTMENNRSSCSFNVAEKDWIDAERWMEKLTGIEHTSVEYAEVQNGYDVYVTLEYWDNYPIVSAYKKNDMTNLTARQEALLRRYDEILEECVTNGMSAYEKELAIHDYLVGHIKYDMTIIGEDIHSAYGALMRGTAVCDGYAESFKTLMDLIGVECCVVRGMGNNEAHAWNMVKLEGAWYHVDVTWDDPVGDMDIISHEYFNMADVQICRDHQWVNENYPSAVGTKYSYYLSGDIMQVHNQEDFDAYLLQCLQQQNENINVVVFGNVNFEDVLKSAGISFRYTYNIIDRQSFKVYELNIIYQ